MCLLFELRVILKIDLDFTQNWTLCLRLCEANFHKTLIINVFAHQINL